ncbi:PadR family transcriptional regulator [Streptomyces sp. 150FB]|uniref:PadR family transcriptional regulator n=1 Tax=Streptomyces sp. 150FB TaxID=1576605 RepID=UPI0005895CDD|nr:PadR family transcriptional regulator [Streptomyces sp. 150FB]KIF77600.1 PadR family transcriptional regulator [Streptomyces sp. 150FB]
MSLTQALLGLLALEPASGYELSKEFERDLGRYAWYASHTSIYPELIRMTGRGLVEVTGEGARRSRTYEVTDKGREELRKWLLSPPDLGRVRNEQVLRMFLLDALEPADALILLRRFAEGMEQGAATLAELRVRHDEKAPTGRDGLGVLAAEYGLRQYEAMRGWALWAIERLERTPEA